MGLALQLYNGYRSKHLIETLHAFGICASYTEVRQFLTSAANHEIAKTEVSCIPYGISHNTLDSNFIQEGADNIDINTETIDGKNTMHSMARAVFQVVQYHTPTSEISSTKTFILTRDHFILSIVSTVRFCPLLQLFFL